MIKFEKLRYKNFLSTGNNFTEIDFLNSPTTLVVGHNGAGKSTMLDALSFALFGKPHRKISKAQLINTVNGKGTLVEVLFTVNSVKYKIVRGIKPNVFEIWANDNMINQNSHAKEYQQILEKNILKLTHKSFHQIVVLGSSSFVPFMQLNTGARREVIEDLLDINMFSKMNGLLKEKMSILKQDINDNAHAIELVKTQINSQKKYLRDLSALNSAHRKEKEEEIQTIEAEIKQLQDYNLEHTRDANESYDKVSFKLEQVQKSREELLTYQSTFKSQIKSLVKESKFFEEHTVCPTCDQSLSDDLRDEKKKSANSRAKELGQAMSKSDEQMDKFDADIAELNTEMTSVRETQQQVNSNNQEISSLNRRISRIHAELSELAENSEDMNEANESLRELSSDLETKQDQKYKLHENYSYQQVCGELLKDTGIKTKIIKQYLPVINQLTNQYLQILDFFVHFDLDESFNETIRSRFRDNFSYDSFSEGEKQRIDLSLLFTWRQIAKMKNSVATNLLILDETFDSSLDDDGVDNLMKILYSLGEQDTNVFVISHKAELEDAQFNRRIEFVKEKNFSKIKAEAA
jgi:DNA repair exonuclease SbcCD ATPase subunit